jgi:hypothetical protein
MPAGAVESRDQLDHLARRTGLCSGRMMTPLFTLILVVAPAVPLALVA